MAAFDPPDASGQFARWQAEHEEELATVPPTALRVEYGRRGEGLYIRVRIEETQIPPGLRPEATPPTAA